MKLPKTIEELREFIDRAQQVGACVNELYILYNLKTIEEFYEHPGLAFWLHWYSLTVIKGRWVEAEEYIKKDPEAVGWYSVQVIKGRWPEAEESIKRDKYGDWAAPGK